MRTFPNQYVQNVRKSGKFYRAARSVSMPVPVPVWFLGRCLFCNPRARAYTHRKSLQTSQIKRICLNSGQFIFLVLSCIEVD